MARPWWIDDPTKWQRETEEMTRWFPSSQWEERELDGVAFRCWQIIVEPVPPSNEIPLVLADLDKDKSIDVERGGKVRHDARCHTLHFPRPELQNVRLAGEAFMVELLYREPPAHPLVHCLEPRLSKQTLPDHPHFYFDDIICPLFPSDGTWQWSRDTAADYIVHVVLWLLKTVAWLATKQELGKGIWVGSDADHSLAALLRTDPSNQCPCGSGRAYHDCCLLQHRATAKQQQLITRSIDRQTPQFPGSARSYRLL